MACLNSGPGMTSLRRPVSTSESYFYALRNHNRTLSKFNHFAIKMQFLLWIDKIRKNCKSFEDLKILSQIILYYLVVILNSILSMFISISIHKHTFAYIININVLYCSFLFVRSLTYYGIIVDIVVKLNVTTYREIILSKMISKWHKYRLLCS